MLAAIIAAVISPSSAAGAFPGDNGSLVVAVEGCDRYHRHLVTMPWRGGSLLPITAPCDEAKASGEAGSEVYRPDASPDGRRIVAAGEATAYEPVSGPRDFFFTTMNADGSDQRRFELPADVISPGGPSFDPTGTRFVFHDDPGVGGTSIWEGKADRTGFRTIAAARTAGRPTAPGTARRS